MDKYFFFRKIMDLMDEIGEEVIYASMADDNISVKTKNSMVWIDIKKGADA